MKAFSVAFALVTAMCASPAVGQQPTGKPEIPAGDGAVYAQLEKHSGGEPTLVWRCCVPGETRTRDLRIRIRGYAPRPLKLKS